MYSALPVNSGWTKDGNTFTIDWEDPAVINKIKGTIDFLTKGCSCKKGCATNKCGCRKKSNHCGQGCECWSWANLADYGQNVSTQDSDEDNSTEEEYDTTDTKISSTEEYDDLETKIITDFRFNPSPLP